MNVPKIDLKALKNIDYSKAVDFAKRRGVLVASGLVILIIPLTAWWFRGGMVDSVMEIMQKRSKEFDKITSLEKASVTVRNATGNPDTTSVTLNPSLIEALKVRNESLDGELKGVYQIALDHNKKNHDIVKTARVVFPKPKDEDKDTIEEEFNPAIVKLYNDFITTQRLAAPPSIAQVAQAVQKGESNYIESTLKRKNRSEVIPEEIRGLEEALISARIAFLGEWTQDIMVYVDPGAIRKPRLKGVLSLDAMFVLQWDFWVIQDIFSAISNVNHGSKGVIKEPVKRVMSIRIDPPTSADAAVPASTETTPGEEPPAAEPPAAEPPAEPPAEAATAAATPGAVVALTGEAIVPTTEIVRDYKRSFTGLKSCQLYDVRNVKIKIVVATADILKVIDEFSKQNFMAVTQLSMAPANTFLAARQGYIYGMEPCSEVSMVLQTVWLRDWTSEFMPVALKNTIGTLGVDKPVEPAAEPAAKESKQNNEEPKS